MTKFIYSDVINGNALIEAWEIDGIEVDVCAHMDDVRENLRLMGDGDGEVFERILEVPDELVELIIEEYGCRL